MTLQTGALVGPYQISERLGAGGMGEVYRARDARLGREIAIKILPTSFSTDAERLRRFEQEARAAGSLSHPNVLVVHDVGRHDEIPYIVSELLEGTTLREAMHGRAMPARVSVDYGQQIAAGLAAAHERGIVHRDLKPENVFVTRDGRVKILDFGIAKLMEPEGGDTGRAPTPTVTARHVTGPGAVLGTAAYMSPEQLRGERVDHRTDLFSLGVVLHEMLGGRSPFARDSAIESMHAILSEDSPDLNGVPPALDRVVRHCLEKDLARRFQSARDVGFALEGALAPTGPAHAPVPVALFHRFRSLVPWTLAGFLLVTSAVLGVLYSRQPGIDSPVVRFALSPPPGSQFGSWWNAGESLAIAPDGHAVVLVVVSGGRRHLELRALDSAVSSVLPGTEDARNPFWSHDSRWIAFNAGNVLKKMDTTGGQPQTICRLQSVANSLLHGTWNADGTILFAGDALGLSKVSATGGEPVPAPGTPPNEILFWPEFLPDGRHFLYLRLALRVDGQPDSRGQSELMLGSLDGAAPVRVMRALSKAVYLDTGYLLFVREGALLAQQFDLAAQQLGGEPAAIAEGVSHFQRVGSSDFSVSRNGLLAFQAASRPSQLVWLTRDGSQAGIVGEPANYLLAFRLSPDGQRLVAARALPGTSTADLWLLDLARGTETRFTSQPVTEYTPAWSPDSREILFVADEGGPPFLHVKRVGQVGDGVPIIAPGRFPQSAWDWADRADGTFAIYEDGSNLTGRDLMLLPMSGERKPRVFLRTPFDEVDARFSPDGRWVAYVTNESGRNEVVVRPFDGSSEPQQISTAGAMSPRWSRRSHELFFIGSDGRLMRSAVTASGLGAPTALFTIDAQDGLYEVSDDGQRFLVNRGSGPSPVQVIVNWPAALRR
jgi:eukaryotic-like serine/threonine-protein kinase